MNMTLRSDQQARDSLAREIWRLRKAVHIDRTRPFANWCRGFIIGFATALEPTAKTGRQVVRIVKMRVFQYRRA